MSDVEQPKKKRTRFHLVEITVRVLSPLTLRETVDSLAGNRVVVNVGGENLQIVGASARKFTP